MNRIETLRDIVEFTRLTTPHIKNIDCFEIEREQRVKLEVLVSFWYGLFFGRSYIKHLRNKIEPRLMLGIKVDCELRIIPKT